MSVTLVDVMGNELSVVNAARVSLGKKHASNEKETRELECYRIFSLIIDLKFEILSFFSKTSSISNSLRNLSILL